MEQIAIRNLTFAYRADSSFSLKDVSLEIPSGEIVLITGVSGCGKTTLLRHLKNVYMPVGIRNPESEIWINGRAIASLDEKEQARMVGFVHQSVEAAQVTDTVWHELAFGLESLGYAQDIMQRRVAEMVAFFGLENIYHEKLCNLSGGQKQLVNLAAVMVMEPDILVLDEPTSQLDPIAATEFFRMLEKINKELGTTILMTEHRLEEVFSMCDRVCVLEEGQILTTGTPQFVAGELHRIRHTLEKALPVSARLYLAMDGDDKRVPLTVNEGRCWLTDYMKINACDKFPKSEEGVTVEETKRLPAPVSADELWFRYEKAGRDILKACSITIEQGKITSILGGNGTGKSTLLNVLAGHYQPYGGSIKYNGKRLTKDKQELESVGMLPQNPQAMFAKKTVEEELITSLGCKKSSDKEKKDIACKLSEVTEFFGLASVLKQHPFDLSGGEMQKLALAKLLLEDREILLLDEPGKGMDYGFKEKMGRLLQQLAAQGKTILMVSHDVEFCARYADKCGLFFDGKIVSLENTRDFFLQNSFYTTAVARMCRNLLPQAVIEEDVWHGLGIHRNQDTHQPDCPIHWEDENRKGDKRDTGERLETAREPAKKAPGQESSSQRKHAAGKGGWLVSFVMVFAVMPLTIYVGQVVLLQRKYYFISLLLVLEAIACFFLRFERRKPRVREIMLIAMMSAIVVAARAAFYMVPNVKPMAALVILSGVGLGAEAGFLVGSLSMLVSNIFFGQGPWTPWQMFAMGILGFLAGVVFRNRTVETRGWKLAVCIFGLLSVVLVYGGIMNPASVLMYQENVNMKMILTACAAGFPYDLMHGVATFIFLWIGTRPLLDKLQRVREKSQFLL